MNVWGNNKVVGGGVGATLLATAVFSMMLLGSVPAFAQSADAAKVYVKTEGFYRVSVSNLAVALGMTTSQVQATAFSVMNMGDEVASIRNTQGDVVFYAHAFSGPYSDENVFWVAPGSASTIPSLAVTSGSSPYPASFLVGKRFEQHLLIRADLVTSVEEDPILWRMLTSGLVTKSFTTTITLDSVAAGSGGVLKIRLKGATDGAGKYYHRARVDLNGVALGTMDFNGFETKEASFTVTAFSNGNNTIKVESTPPAGTTFDSFYLDYIHADYQRSFNATNNRLTAAVGAGSVQMTGFTSSNLVVWDVANQWGIKSVTGYQKVSNASLWNINFTAPATSRVAAVVPGSELLPLRVTSFDDIGLKDTDWDLDHLVIASDVLTNAVELTSYRAAQGLESAAITINDVYDAFNYGIRDARAIDRFLKYAYRNWAKAPHYVVLAGDGSLDNRNLMGYNDSLIPAVPLMGPNGLYASDYTYGDPAGTGQLEIAVGRIPVNTVQKMDEFIEKIVTFENGGNWRTNQLISTDANDFGGDFLGIGNELSSILEGNVYRGDLTTQTLSDVRTAVIGGMNQGREVSLYVGHGTPNQLSSQSILLLNDLPALTNKSAPTAFLAIGCLIGAFNDPGKVNLGEGLVTAQGGASMVMAAATLISAADGKVLSESLLENVYDNGTDRIGDAWKIGKNQLTASFRSPAFKAFQFLGDPATAIGDPQAAPPAGDAPGLPSYEEWAQTYLAPVLEDQGVTLEQNADVDGDGVSNFGEYKAGTNPFDVQSVLRISKMKRPNGSDVQITWPSSSSRTYAVEWAPAVTGPYTVLTNGIPADAPFNVADFIEASGQPRFYRVVVE